MLISHMYFSNQDSDQQISKIVQIIIQYWKYLQLQKMNNQKSESTLTNRKTKQISKSKIVHYYNKLVKNTKRPSSDIISSQFHQSGNNNNSFDLNSTSIPYSHLIFSNKKIHQMSCLKHIFSVFAGINYGIKMRELTKQQLQKYKFQLPTQYNHKKTLFLGLDQTLIHTVQSQKNCQHKVNLQVDGINKQVYFNLRPYAQEFLKILSQIYQIYIFTTSIDQYAQAMMNFLNLEFKSISGYLSRQNCIKTFLGIYIKDLSRICNRNLKQMILVDNLSYCFGNLIQNGIPILQFKSDKSDEQLMNLKSYLIEAAKYDDVREFNREYLKLREIVNIKQCFGK